MKSTLKLVFLLLLAIAATASVRAIDGDPLPPCPPGTVCNP